MRPMPASIRLAVLVPLALLATRAAAAPADPANPAGSGCNDREPYDPAALRDRVAHLAAVELDGRAAGSPGDAAARSYLAGEFRCAGLVPAGDDGSYAQRFVADGHPTENLIGYLPGSGA